MKLEAYLTGLPQPADLSNQHAVYIHIPFCQTRCLYCGFYQNASRLLEMIQRSFSLVPEKIEAWLSHGVNRISLGVQSFDTVLRQRVGRIDSREEVLKRLALLKKYDVTVIVDLIYGLPGQTMATWMEDVRTLALADVDGMDL